MILDQVDPGDAAAVDDYVTVTNAVRAADSPWEHPLTPHEAVGQLTHGWDGEPSVGFVGRVGGSPVAAGEYAVSEYDNRHVAWVEVNVAPGHRRRGYGSAVLAALRDRARAEGRTSLGIGGWESRAAVAFATRHGLEQKSVEVNRRQWLADLDRDVLAAAHAEALAHAGDYELLRIAGCSPPDLLPALAVMTAAINDAPTDDLDIEDSVFPPERIAAYDAAQAARGHRMYRLVARRRADGELAGQSVVAVEGERPALAEQHDTSVVAAHRGHRLGQLLKTDMLRWLAEAEPQVETIDTWNAESNARMIDVNERLGYRVVGRGLVFQGSI
ncbi:MAG TPA: GNAT family N-acetyltransferase [Nocardioides sp.]|uniref:GNAT family N-acetyltransferase n=1 Tax=Nocardioides sp. TaxID=35761 RepID=UPI002C41592D|nr:GNAT family N-acetyltransferase [Nocardioides sp.]HTW14471.1 GNAT family N-acetyltransferase [Nocardioides sp.]